MIYEWYLVQVDVVVKGQDVGQPQFPEFGDCVSQDEHQDDGGVEEQASAVGPRQHVEGVGRGAAEHAEVAEIVGSHNE